MGEIVLYGKGKSYGKGKDDLASRIPRKTVDYGSDVVRWLQECLVPRTSAQQLPGHYSFTRELMPPFATPQGPYDAICPRFVHAAQNKTRAPVYVVHWFPHGRRLLSGMQTGEMTIWGGTQFMSENVLQAHNGAIRAMQWTPEEHVLISGDQLGIIKFWDQYIFNFQTIQAHKESICDISVAPSGQKFVSCADDSHAKVWDLKTGEEERAFTGHGWDVKCCDWHPTKGLVATGSKDSQIKLWDPRASEAITTIYCHNNTVTKVKWSPHGQFLASGSKDQLIMLMDVRTMSVRKVLRGHTKDVTALCWHPESEAVLASGGHEAAINFWDTFGASTPFERVPGAHEGPVWSLAWHPLGHLLVSGSNDYSTRFWSRARPGDTSFTDLLPRKVAYGANDAPVKIADDMHVGSIFQSGIFADPPLPPMSPEERAAAAAEEAARLEAEAEAERAKNYEPMLGLSVGEGADKKDVFDTSDFDAELGELGIAQPAATAAAVPEPVAAAAAGAGRRPGPTDEGTAKAAAEAGLAEAAAPLGVESTATAEKRPAEAAAEPQAKRPKAEDEEPSQKQSEAEGLASGS